MSHFNFQNLTPEEFEALAQDVMQRLLSTPLFRYAAGPDGGIDLCDDLRTNRIIVQCKRYRDYKSLLQSLKDERKKLERIEPTPEKYYVFTSVGLLPQQKKTVLELFQPYMESEANIIDAIAIEDFFNAPQNYDLISKNNNLFVSYPAGYNHKDDAEQKALRDRLSRGSNDRQRVSKDGTWKKANPIDEVPAEWCKEVCTALRRMIERINEKTNWAADTYTPIPVEWEWRDKRRKKKEENLLKAIENNHDKAAVYLLLGAPGSGKSVSLRKLTLEMLDQFHKTKRLPLYVNLGEWENASLSGKIKEKDFYDSLLSHIKQYVQNSLREEIIFQNASNISEHETFDYLLKRKGFFFIFDSFDEMPCLMGSQDVDETRQIADMLSRWFRKFLENGNGGIIASRKEDIWPTSALKQSVTIEVLEFDDERIGKLIQNFFSSEPEKGRAVIKKLFTEQSDLVPALRNPLYLSLFINFATLHILDHEEAEPNRPSIKLADLFEHYVQTTLKQYLRDHSAETSLSFDILLDRAKDLAFQMQEPPNQSLLISIKDLPERSPQSYWTEAITVFKDTKLCRGGRDQGTVAFAHRRFQEYFYISYLNNHIDHPFRDYEQSILGYTSNRDALILYCEVADLEAAEEIAKSCWGQIQKRREAIKTISQPKAKELAYALQFMSEAFRLRKDALETFLPEFEQFICETLSQDIDYVISCALAGCVSLLGDAALQEAVSLAFKSKKSLLIETALRSIRISRQIDKKLGSLLVAHLSGRSTITKWKQRRQLQFSFSLSPAFKPVKAYERCNRIRDIFAVLCAVLVIIFGAICIRHYEPGKDFLTTTSVEQKLLSDAEAPTPPLGDIVDEIVEKLKTGKTWEEISFAPMLSFGLMMIGVFYFLFFDHASQAMKEAYTAYASRGREAKRKAPIGLFSLTERSEMYYRHTVFVPFFAFMLSSGFILICRDVRSNRILFFLLLLVEATTAVVFLATEIASNKCIYSKATRKERAEKRKRYIHSLLNRSERKALLKKYYHAVSHFFQNKVALFFTLTSILVLVSVIALAYLFYAMYKQLEPSLSTIKSAQDTESGEELGIIACIFLILLILFGVVRTIHENKRIMKKLSEKMAYKHINRAAVEDDLIKLSSDAARRRYVRKFDEALEEAKEKERDKAQDEGREEEYIGLVESWPNVSRPTFKSDELNAALAKLDCEDERLRSIIP